MHYLHGEAVQKGCLTLNMTALILRNFGNYLPVDDAALHLRTLESSATPVTLHQIPTTALKN